VRESDASSSAAEIIESVAEERHTLASLLAEAQRQQLEAEAALAEAGAGKAMVERELLAQTTFPEDAQEAGGELDARLRHERAQREALERQCAATADMCVAANKMLRQVQGQHATLAAALEAERAQRGALVAYLQAIQQRYGEGEGAGSGPPSGGTTPRAWAAPEAAAPRAAGQQGARPHARLLPGSAQDGQAAQPPPLRAQPPQAPGPPAATWPSGGGALGAVRAATAWAAAAVEPAAAAARLLCAYCFTLALLPLHVVLLSRPFAFASAAAAALAELIEPTAHWGVRSASRRARAATAKACHRWRLWP
jgi:hypothetical protein